MCRRLDSKPPREKETRGDASRATGPRAVPCRAAGGPLLRPCWQRHGFTQARTWRPRLGSLAPNGSLLCFVFWLVSPPAFCVSIRLGDGGHMTPDDHAGIRSIDALYLCLAGSSGVPARRQSLDQGTPAASVLF
ncbi:hypothetical protein E2562_029031 [Oryza meyeriana var. granulata]|uniref:Uncharacterized protein n=1 Tax=Oryza meyeriana var. granulata TaxID=110450 RepID=A0A6G1E5P6_9ORYZ|nr:hypothetical protein E2562_029031 [Oryza meyeriana var. granulata]